MRVCVCVCVWLCIVVCCSDGGLLQGACSVPFQFAQFESLVNPFWFLGTCSCAVGIECNRGILAFDAMAFEVLDNKTEEFASTDEKLASNNEDIEDTQKSLAADEEFLAMLKEQCSDTDAEWEGREKTCQLEMVACSNALVVLSSDDAHDLFTKIFNPMAN